METKQQPLISIGMIFRDDIRSIERCLKALEPLRKAVPCELVMADTGSQDGSRAIAEQYADILIDFEWINDFSAARNAVMDECSGKWHLTIDTDEYFREDSDLEGLKTFLDTADLQGCDLATVCIRNHDSYDLDGDYTDFMGIRLLRMSTGARYTGALHEAWVISKKKQSRMAALPHVVFDHDGYVGMGEGSAKGKEKRERNMKLLREKMKTNPTSLLTWLQYIESGSLEQDYLKQIRHAVRMVKRKVEGWQSFGPPILRYAVYAADGNKLPEVDEWAALAERLFPQSMYTRLDVEYAMFARSWNDNDYADCVERGERYLLALKDFRAGKDPTATIYSVLKMASPIQEQGVKIVLSSACAYEGKLERALELLMELDFTQLSGKQTMDTLKSAQEVHFRSDLDTVPLITAFWEGITTPKPSQKQADHRKAVFNTIAAMPFDPANQKRERKQDEFHRYGYTLYEPLRGKNEAGNAAWVMSLKDPVELDRALRKIEHWSIFPIAALGHALQCGTQFPLPGEPLPIEEMEGLAKRLCRDDEEFFSTVLQLAEGGQNGWQRLTWIRALLIGAVRVFGWEKDLSLMDPEKADKHKQTGLALARSFGRVEREFISRYYAEEVRTEENIHVLPPMHRFGWHCAQAFEALDKNDLKGFVQELEAGLRLYKDIVKMAEFLLEWIRKREQAVRIAEAPPELITLANQVKVMLARFDPGDPAVDELKNSPAYQQVAWLIDEPVQLAFETPVQ